MKESTYQRKIIGYIKGLNQTIKFANQAMIKKDKDTKVTLRSGTFKCIKLESSNHVGLTDLMILFGGVSLFLELKKDKTPKSAAGKLSARQKAFQLWLVDNRFLSCSLWPHDDYKGIIQDFIQFVQAKNSVFDPIWNKCLEEMPKTVTH